MPQLTTHHQSRNRQRADIPNRARQEADPAPSLRDTPGSSTARQHQMLVIEGGKHGFDLHEVRRMVGGSLRKLSAKQASEWIKLFSNRDLPNPPGGKPWPYKRRSTAVPAVPRMIQDSHVEQIGRLMLRYFEGNVAAASAWFLKNWKVEEPRDLLDTARAGEVIRVLKEMVARRESPAASGLGRKESMLI